MAPFRAIRTFPEHVALACFPFAAEPSFDLTRPGGCHPDMRGGNKILARPDRMSLYCDTGRPNSSHWLAAMVYAYFPAVNQLIFELGNKDGIER
jgi:hypothetical protein